MQTAIQQQQIRGISLRKILPNSRFFGAQDIFLGSCCADSRLCKPGDLFVAVDGPCEDGHQYARQAVENGAVAVLGERMVPVEVPMCVVDDSREAYGKLCQALMGNPSEQIQVIGVTGTSGKTTVSMLIASVLEVAGHRPGVMGSLGFSDGLDSTSVYGNKITPAKLAHWLARVNANRCSHAVLELSSIDLATRQMAGIQLDIACLTNVKRRNIDFHGSVLKYRQAKGRVFRQLAPGGLAVINSDDPASKFLLSQIRHPLLTVGIKNPAELNATSIERRLSEQTFLISAGSETVPVCTKIIGDQHIYNCLTAAAVGLVYGIDLPTIVRGLEAVSVVPQHLERIECGQGFGVFVDSVCTPDSLANSLRTLRQVTRGRLICVYGAPGDRDRDNRPLLGRAVERLADTGVITSDIPGTEPPLAIMHEILDGYDRPSRSQVIPDRIHAMNWALQHARPTDSVLITGSPVRHQQEHNGIMTSFTDPEFVREWLYESVKTKRDEPWLTSFARG